MPRVDVVVHAVGETVGQHALPAVIPSTTTFAAPTIKVSRTATPAHFTKSTTFGAPTITTTGGSTITHGDQINASNTGFGALFGATVANLTNQADISYSTTQTVSRKRFTGRVDVTAGTVTFSECWWDGGGGGSSLTQLYVGGAAGAALNYCTFSTNAGSSAFICLWLDGSGAVTINRVDASGAENIMSCYNSEIGAQAEITESYFHDPRNNDNPSGHKDIIEMYNGRARFRRCRIETAPSDTASVAAFNIAPWMPANLRVNDIIIEDNFIDGCGRSILRDLQSGVGSGGTGYIRGMRVLRNKFGGHNWIAPYTAYDHLHTADDSTNGYSIVASEALRTDPDQMVWPNSGVDRNTWSETQLHGAPLTPNNDGATVTASG